MTRPTSPNLRTVTRQTTASYECAIRKHYGSLTLGVIASDHALRNDYSVEFLCSRSLEVSVMEKVTI